MKFFLCLWLFLLSCLAVQGSIDAGPQAYLVNAQTVYFVRASAVKKDSVTFSVTETLKGKPQVKLTLAPAWDEDFKPGTEWLLISMPPGGGKNAVGGVFSGFCEWYPARVTHNDTSTEVVGVGSLEETRKLLQAPSKP